MRRSTSRTAGQSFSRKSPRKEDPPLGDGARCIRQLLCLLLLLPSDPLRPPVLKTSPHPLLLHPLPKTQSPLFHHFDATISLPPARSNRSTAVKPWKGKRQLGRRGPPVGFFSGEKINWSFKSPLNERGGEGRLPGSRFQILVDSFGRGRGRGGPRDLKGSPKTKTKCLSGQPA